MKVNAGSAADQKMILEFSSNCLLMRTRLISRVLTNLYDQALREFGINSPQFSMLAVICRLGPASRAEIGRHHHQDRSTLTRNLKIMIDAGWIEESSTHTGGRARPMVITEAGMRLLRAVEPAWRDTQERVKTMLGEANVLAIDDMANRVRKSKTAD
jgi:DNA-binding MarR family transcriptional regulator